MHLAVAGSLAAALGVAFASRTGVACGGALLIGLAIARAVTEINVARIRSAGFEMLWQTSERVRRLARGESVELLAELRNRDARAARFAHLRAVSAPGLSVRVEPEHAEVPAGGRLQVRVSVTALSVGRHAVHGLSLELRGGPGLFEIPLTFANPFGIEVLPHAYARLARTTAGGRSRRVAEQNRSKPYAGESLELRELRQHHPGDPLRKVAWKASARRGQLLVREYEREERDVVFLLVDAATELAAGAPGTTALDHLLDDAASVALRHLQRGDRVGLGIIGRRVLAWQPPARGNAQALKLFEALAHAATPVQFERSGLDETDVAQRVLEHLRPLAPDIAGNVGPYELDRLARRAEKMLTRAPFAQGGQSESGPPAALLQEMHAASPRERVLRTYLEAYGIGSPTRVGTERLEVDELLVQALARSANLRPEPTLLYIFSPAPTAASRPALLQALRRRQRNRTQVIWSSTPLTAGAEPTSGAAGVAARALTRRAAANASEGERALRRAGVLVEHPPSAKSA